jgi:Ca-activated chloride channel family protein
VTPFAALPGDTRFAAAVAEYGMLLRESTHAPNANFEHVVATAQAAMGNDTEGHRAEFTVLARKARDLAREKKLSQR